MNRRQACTLLAAAGGLPAGPALARGGAEASAWQRWKERFLAPEGRVVDALQDRITHSEGQGYALLLAQAQGDREAFDRIEEWTRRHLLRRGDALMAWRWRPEAPESPDLQTATDGDLFRAWALIRAARDSGRPGLLPEAQRIARALAAACLVPDPRAPAEFLLSPFARPEGTGAAVLVNPSYYMTRALRELGASAGLPELIRTADHGEGLLAELAVARWLPDWLAVTRDGPVEAQGYFPGFGYDALRIPLYLVWSGRGDHPAVALAASLLGSAGTRVPTVTRRDGTAEQTSDLAGYQALRAVVAAAARGGAAPELPMTAGRGASYYPATLGLLSQVAVREGGPWPAPAD